jgi:hypothetical protein
VPVIGSSARSAANLAAAAGCFLGFCHGDAAV